MTHKQHKLGTPCTPASTADEVFAGTDLAGESPIVTGGHAGIGLEVTRTLANAGASVTIGARDPGRAAAERLWTLSERLLDEGAAPLSR